MGLQYSLSKKFDVAFVEETLKKMISKHGIQKELFFKEDEMKIHFQDRTRIYALAEKSSDFIKKLGAEDFNPLD